MGCVSRTIRRYGALSVRREESGLAAGSARRGRLSGIAVEKVLDLCDKRDLWTVAYDHPTGHRTSNMLDRLMRSMNRYFDDGGHLHGSHAACDQQHCRAWALLHNFTPWHPATSQENDGWQSPAERLNHHRYHENWLHNLLVSASLGGLTLAASSQVRAASAPTTALAGLPAGTPLRVKPVLVYGLPQRKEKTSWRGYGGLQTPKGSRRPGPTGR